MPILVPAILTRDPEEIYEKIKFLESIPEINEIQIDFADGQFVGNTSILPSDLEPFNSRLKFEAHLMTQHPQRYFHHLEHIGVNTVVIHYESFGRISDLETAVSNAKILGLRCGAAINPETEVAVLDRFAEKIDLITLLAVHPGYQGQKFIPETLDRLQTLRKRHARAIIEVDGGINLDNFGSIMGYGASRLVVGSGIWQTRDPRQTIYDFLARLK